MKAKCLIDNLVPDKPEVWLKTVAQPPDYMLALHNRRSLTAVVKADSVDWGMLRDVPAKAVAFDASQEDYYKLKLLMVKVKTALTSQADLVYRNARYERRSDIKDWLKDAITPYYGVKGVTFSLVDKDGKPLSASQIKALEREWIMKRIDSRTM